MKINVNVPKSPTPVVGVPIKDLHYGELYLVDSVDWEIHGKTFGGKNLAGLYIKGVSEFRSLYDTNVWFGMDSGVTVTNPRKVKSATIDVTLEEA